MDFTVNDINRISTFLAFVRAAAKAKFQVSPELIGEVLKRCNAYARKHGIQIHIQGIPSKQLLQYIGVGAAVGAAAGFVLGAGVGIVGGALLGAAAGAVLAHVSITVSFADSGNATFSIN